MRRFPFLLFAVLTLDACPSTSDDDTTGDDDATDDGHAPIIDSVDLCEVPGSRDFCDDQDLEDAINVGIDVQLHDDDCDLNNPVYLVGVALFPPLVDGFIEQDLGCGGAVRITLEGCIGIGRLDVPFRVKFRDAASPTHESDPFDGTWTNPGDSHNDDCGPWGD